MSPFTQALCLGLKLSQNDDTYLKKMVFVGQRTVYMIYHFLTYVDQICYSYFIWKDGQFIMVLTTLHVGNQMFWGLISVTLLMWYNLNFLKNINDTS